ncbi:hypothetical protein DM01DRAFT_1337274 [Hesseltinella vesiculosa]|uniref:Uncharacterized protein n=1 Tax=Hesseltinella vesiculosa TaxID=101127 RepID=A0A1X2GDE3_9FUNG|nr:hypothetical protein DM01DRAFT_1337274 [Hesseltinella vesiculosa]
MGTDDTQWTDLFDLLTDSSEEEEWTTIEKTKAIEERHRDSESEQSSLESLVSQFVWQIQQTRDDSPWSLKRDHSPISARMANAKGNVAPKGSKLDLLNRVMSINALDVVACIVSSVFILHSFCSILLTFFSVREIVINH